NKKTIVLVNYTFQQVEVRSNASDYILCNTIIMYLNECFVEKTFLNLCVTYFFFFAITYELLARGQFLEGMSGEASRAGVQRLRGVVAAHGVVHWGRGDVQWRVLVGVESDVYSLTYIAKNRRHIPRHAGSMQIQVAEFNVHEFRFEGGMSALHYLLERSPHRSKYDARGTKTKEMVDYLLEDTLENYQDDHGFTYLHGACMTGNVSAILRYISQGVDVALDTYEYSPLHIAVQFKNAEIIKILLENGANPNHQESSVQSTPMFWLAIPRCLCEHDCYSCEEKKPVGEIVDVLVQYGANIEARNAQGVDVALDTYEYSPLHIAVQFKNAEIIKILLENGANPNHQESSVQSTPMFWLAIPRCLCEHDCYSCEEKKPVGEIVDVLVQYGANIEARNAFEGGMSALHYSLERSPHRSKYDARGTKTKEMVDYLLEDTLENYQDDHGFTYLHGACMTGNVSAILRYISQGVDVALDTYEYSPLHIAVQFKNAEIIKILLENGANPNHQESSVQSTPMFWLAIPRCLCEHDCYSCEEKKPVGEIVDVLVQYGANIEARNAYGDHPLQIAVSRFKVQLTRSLLNRGARLSSLDANKVFAVNFNEKELKSYPITSNIVKVMQLLQSHGYELNMRTRLSLIKYWIKVKNESILVGVHPENTLIRPQLELFVADLFMMDYCKLNLPYVACRNIAEHMCDEELIRLCEETDEEKLERTILPMPKRRRLC
ncbi:unnamed protein product, partial [Trichogramma brassicae]